MQRAASLCDVMGMANQSGIDIERAKFECLNDRDVWRIDFHFSVVTL